MKPMTIQVAVVCSVCREPVKSGCAWKLELQPADSSWPALHWECAEKKIGWIMSILEANRIPGTTLKIELTRVMTPHIETADDVEVDYLTDPEIGRP